MSFLNRKNIQKNGYLLTTGLETQEAGQLSPATKATQDNMNLKVA
jgi:hypothetical protein